MYRVAQKTNKNLYCLYIKRDKLDQILKIFPREYDIFKTLANFKMKEFNKVYLNFLKFKIYKQ